MNGFDNSIKGIGKQYVFISHLGILVLRCAGDDITKGCQNMAF